MPQIEVPPAVRIRDLVLYFLRLGALGFGGPVALCGQMEKDLVEERQWLTAEEMREGIAVCQSLPGPLAIQVGIFVSYLRGGFWGALSGSVCSVSTTSRPSGACSPASHNPDPLRCSATTTMGKGQHIENNPERIPPDVYRIS